MEKEMDTAFSVAGVAVSLEKLARNQIDDLRVIERDNRFNV
jgi:hypothetical protein